MEKELRMKKRLLSILVAILFTAGTFALPISASAQGISGQMTEEGTAKKSTAKKSTTKKSKKPKTSKQPSSTKKSKSKKSPDQQA
jgi:Ni/Co efflux regulator RcnB